MAKRSLIFEYPSNYNCTQPKDGQNEPKHVAIGNVIKSRPTRCNKITVFIDLQDQLNIFRINICPASGA
jgi:hypothetical protein